MPTARAGHEPSPTVSAVPVTIPIAFTDGWRSEIAAAAGEHGVLREALNAAAFTWLMKIARWEATDIDGMLNALARQQQARMGMAMAMGAALAAAQVIETRSAVTAGHSPQGESAVPKAGAQTPPPSSHKHQEQVN